MEIYKKKLILIADDDEDDLMFAQKAINANSEESEIDIKLVKDGEELLDFLYKKGEYADSKHPLPSVIFLDIKMPKLDGLKVLEILKANERLRIIPIIILSSSKTDINSSYHKGANSYIVKPNIYGEMQEIMGKMKKFWFEAAELPGENND